MAQKIRTLIGFSKQSDQQLVATAGAVVRGMTGNKAFPSPSPDLTAVQAALDELNAAIAAQPHGGAKATADKNNKREALIGVLQRLAQYVQLNCGNDLAVLLSSGFSAAAAGIRTRLPLDKPSIVSVDNGNSSQLLVKVSKIANARCYELRSAAIGAGGAPGPWQGGGSFTDSRSLPVNGLTPGTTYAIQARAIGSAGYSDWSDTVTHMCM